MDSTSFSQSFVAEVRENFDDLSFQISELDEQVAQCYRILWLISEELNIEIKQEQANAG